LERTILLLLGLCTTLDPAMNPARTIQPYVEEFVLGRGRDWVTIVRSAVKDMTLSALTIPEGVSRLVARANRGELYVRVQSLREGGNLVYAAAQQLVFGVLGAAAAIIAYISHERGDEIVAVGASIAAALFLIGVLASIVSARRWRKGR